MFKEDYKRTFDRVRPSAEFDPEVIYMKANKKRTPMRRVASVALAAALLLALSVTAYATDLFGIMDFVSGKLEDTEQQLVSISGYADSAEAKASAEWEAYRYDCVMQGIAYEEGLPEQAGYYGAGNQEMYDRLQEIAANYGLVLLEGLEVCTPDNPVPNYVKDGFDGGQVGYRYANGSFKAEHTMIGSDGVTYPYTVMRNVKGSLTAASYSIQDAESWTQWQYTSPEGYDVLLCINYFPEPGSENMPVVGNRGLLLTDLENCFVYALMTDSMDGPVTVNAMNELAQSLDYARLATIE